MRRPFILWCRALGLPGVLAFCLFGSLATAFAQGPGQDQAQVWVQIEARPTLAEAEDRARAYAAIFPDVAGFRLANGWHAIALGPAAPEAARARLAALLGDRMIPADSFITDSSRYRAPFWPVAGPAPDPSAPPLATALSLLPEITTKPLPAPLGQPAMAQLPVLPAPEPAELAAEPTAEPTAGPAARPATGITDLAALAPVAESLAQATATEAALTKAEREEVQTALQWFGFYQAGIDGAFGRGSRAAMAAWQQANNADPTGVLTTAQRRALVDRYRGASAALGLTQLRETEAGIEIDLPLALVQFDRYEPPFAVFEPRGDSGVRVLLISQPGDKDALAGLYDTLQSLTIIPPEGPRDRGDTSFAITGRNGQFESHAFAELSGGLVKGYVLVWPRAAGDGIARVLPAMQASFRAIGDRALDPGLAPLPQAERDGLLTGLAPRRPLLSRSGFFIDAGGTVLTTPEVQAGCTRITIDGTQEMDVALSDPAAGLLVLTPRGVLAPAIHARFQTAPERIGADITVAGYSYEDALPAPALTFGRVAALAGLAGEPGLKRLDLAALPGDAGGPVVDPTGAVIGMLLPPARDGTRQLPQGVAFAASAMAIAARLGAAGIGLETAADSGALPPEDLARGARGMTVLVSCWN